MLFRILQLLIHLSQPRLAIPADKRAVADILDADSAAVLELNAASVELPVNLSTGPEKEFDEDTLNPDEHEDWDVAINAETPAAELSDMVSSLATNFLDL